MSGIAKDKFGKKLNLNELFNDYKVTIPVLQRDYAQGRVGKEYIRESFLMDIKSCVDFQNVDEHKADFIYGYCNDNEFFPLDGQQRLTTLWLACWYLTVRANKSNDKLLKFTYETRKSSREFCEDICEKVKYSKKTGIVEYIKNQTWFLDKWCNDPTINSMLRMIGGTSDTDGIEPVLGNLPDYDSALNQLMTKYVFYMVPLNDEEMPKEAADRLYVKMNSRGKSLDDFENFRADFIDQFTKNKAEFDGKTFTEINKNTQKSESLPLELYIAKKIDGDWSTVFWNKYNAGHSDGKIDELLFSVIHRFCFGQLIIKKSDIKKEDGNILNEYILNTDYLSVFEKLQYEDVTKIDQKKLMKYESSSDEEKKALPAYLYFENDTQIQYTKYDMYEQILDYPGVIKLINLFNALVDHGKEIEEFFSERFPDDDKMSVFPYYETNDEGDKISHENQSGLLIGNVAYNIDYVWRVLFQGIVKYVEDENKAFDVDNFKSWMRVVYNIVMNAGIDSVSAMVSCIRKIEKLGEHSHDILAELCKLNLKSDANSKLDRQINEEIIKAKQIIYANQSSDSTIVGYDNIVKAEQFGFLEGCIRFLYTDDKGNVDWNAFSTKFSNLQAFFPDGKNASIQYVRMIAKNYKDFDDVWNLMIFHNIGRQRRGESWLDYLCDEKNMDRVHFVLKDGKLSDNATGNNQAYETFVDSDAFIKLVEKDKLAIEKYEDLRAYRHNDKWALYKKSAQAGKLYFDDQNFKRGEYLLALVSDPNFVIDSYCIIFDGEPYFWGENIKFDFKEKKYIWTIQDKIFAYNENTERYSDKKIENVSTIPPADILSKL